ncbi:LacI family DNA-binding transcriptional regulator [Microlunatus sp. Y2014]|uniref:LacI family DNA-binding transcriptional regulator n=1 Tax=Microlunatus sp. Y2014 TaxID=3418488 RepID=UPI003DA7501A
MSTRDRRSRVLRLIDDDGSVTVADLARRFAVSEMTVRRDLEQLAAEGLAVRVRGGATRPSAAPDMGRIAARADLTIGVVVPTTDYVYRPLLSGIDRTLRHAGAASTLRVSRYETDRERTLVDELISSGVDGLLFGPTIDADDLDPGQLDWLSSIDTPTVLLERSLPVTWPGRSLSSIRTSFPRGLTLAMEHLVELGHTGIAFFGHARRMDLVSVNALWAELLARFGLDATHCPLGVDRNFQRWQSDVEAERVLTRVRDAGATALVCRDDTVALTMAHCAQRLGIAVPEDLSLIAYDDELATMGQPPLTAISTPKAALGERATNLLLEHVHDTAYGHTSHRVHIELDPRLVVRGSTAPPA